MSRYPKARFLKSAMSAAAFGDDSGYEVAIAGRSNSGKSSALNAIVRRHGLARTSKTPGRTQAVNLFELEPGKRLADLPGYGHARVPAAVRADWGAADGGVFRGARLARGLLIIVDARRGFGEERRGDARLCARPRPSGRTCCSASATSSGATRRAAGACRRRRRSLGGRAGVQLFSAESGEGVDAAQGALDAMLARRHDKNARRSVRTAGQIPGLGMQSGLTRSGREAGSVSRRSSD